MFGCVFCQRGFVFAKCIEIDASWEGLARRDIEGVLQRPAREDEIEQWGARTKRMTRDLVPGRRYVYLDGSYLRADSGFISFDGWHAKHDLSYVPQVAALRDPGVLDRVLHNVDYWRTNAIRGK